ncbi:MAG: DUF433 domain-containing protein [Bacteroidetes bacterium]|nr:DUF433 domain-containing protein [Bacteroidota bacterium]MCW5894303.1 DUF433 domain-containing protein [Bacteroidota bacterium]
MSTKGVITIDPEVMGGTPVFTGTRVQIETFFDYLVEGESMDDFLRNFPTVSREQAMEVLHMAESLVLKKRTVNEVAS